MTRINSGIKVERLTDEHLVAEHVELTMLPYFKKNKKYSYIPEAFTLGKGHISFWMDKMGWTKDRYNEVRMECLKRGMDVDDFSWKWDGIDKGGYEPTERDTILLEERIEDRIQKSPKLYFHYYKKKISKEEAIDILKNKNDKYLDI